MPKFSVVIPVYNKRPHIERSINSVLEQSFTDFELILIDDASTDGSSEKLKEFSNISKIRLFSRDEPGPGGYAARNLGIKEAKYDWIAFLDADDKWSSDYLASIYKAIKQNNDVSLVTTRWVRVNGEKLINKLDDSKVIIEEIYSDFKLSDYLENLALVWTGAVVVNKSIIQKAGGFPTDNRCKSGGDIDTWIRWLYFSERNIVINSVLSYYHQGTVNQVTSKPTTYFCAYSFLIKIYNETKDENLKLAIIDFINRFIYNMLGKQIEAGMPIDYSQIKKMSFSTYSVLRITKLHLEKIKGVLNSIFKF